MIVVVPDFPVAMARNIVHEVEDHLSDLEVWVKLKRMMSAHIFEF